MLRCSEPVKNMAATAQLLRQLQEAGSTEIQVSGAGTDKAGNIHGRYSASTKLHLNTVLECGVTLGSRFVLIRFLQSVCFRVGSRRQG